MNTSRFVWLTCLIPLCLLALARPASGGILAGPVVNPANGHSYYLLTPSDWVSAEAEAVLLGGHLVMINDAAENAWLLEKFGIFAGGQQAFFIGFTDEGQEGVWRWTSGEEVTYMNWADGEPNNGYPGHPAYPYEHCSWMYVSAASSLLGKWNDVMGSGSAQVLSSIVEIPTKRMTIRVSQVELCWPSTADIVYQVQYCTDLTAGVWVDLGAQHVGTGSDICLTDDVPANGARFYRLLEVP